MTACKIWADEANTTFGYEVILTEKNDEDAYRVWAASGPLSGYYIGGSFAEFHEALAFLAGFIKEGEYDYEA